MGVNVFSSMKSGNLNFALQFFFLYDPTTNKAGKLEVAESNLIIQNNPSPLSLSL